MNENVIITDKKKIEEIRAALQSPDKHFAEIKPAERDKLPENAKKVWFGIDKPNKPWYNKIVAKRRMTSFLYSYKEQSPRRNAEGFVF